MGDGYAKLFMDETPFYNRIVLGSLLPATAWEPLPHWLQTWLRNYIGGLLIYFISTFLWCFYSYYLKRNVYVPKGMAFNPLNGLLQGMPHTITPFLVPTHFTTHIALIFLEAIWTANIHDCIHAKLWPVMGAGYHTIHHITYHHNYGHYTICMDWVFGTLRDPVLEDDESNKDMSINYFLVGTCPNCLS